MFGTLLSTKYGHFQYGMFCCAVYLRPDLTTPPLPLRAGCCGAGAV